jgi:diacylglycerol kinase (ATP)
MSRGESQHGSFGPMVIVANPSSGRGRAGAQLRRIEGLLRDQGLEFRVLFTTGRGHAAEVAAAALRDGARYLVAAGGDGTVNEVVNGIMAAGGAEKSVLGVVPTGSGCDFARTFGIPRNAARAARRLAGDEVRVIDVGMVTFTAGDTTAVRYFANIAEAGMGGSVVARAAGLPAWLGPARYFFGFWLTLPGFQPAAVRVEADGVTAEWTAHNVVVANCQYYGGGMRISPRSEPDDGVLDVLAMIGPKHIAYTILPKFYRGTHLPHRHIAELRATRVTVEAAAPFQVEADGELLGTTTATFEIVPRALRLKI